MILVIAEKPSLGRSISAAMGSEYKVLSAFGHLYELQEPDYYLPDTVPRNTKGAKVWRMEDLPIMPDKWTRIAKKESKDQIKTIAAALKSATLVINAGDPDREGQILIDEIIEECKYTGPVDRVWLTSLTKEGIREAFKNKKPNSEYRGFSQSAEVRSKADWLVGMNLTRAWTVTNRKLISIGRVQTPTLAIVVARDLLIEHFKPTDHFSVSAVITHPNGTYTAKWKPADTSGKGFDWEGHLIDRSIAEQIVSTCQGKRGTITEFKIKDKQRNAPLLFSLNELQKVAFAKYGIGVKETLDIAQALYEVEKVTSYPRTDCRYVGEDQHVELGIIARQLAGKYGVTVDPTLKHATFNDKQITAHTAIVPTGNPADHLTGDQKKIFDLIAKSVVAVFMPPESYQSISVTAAISPEYSFYATGKRVTHPGWTAIDQKADNSANQDDEDSAAIPLMQQGDEVFASAVRVNDLQTKPPARFTQGTLIEAMTSVNKLIDDPVQAAQLKDTLCIGTDATRANIMETLFKRGWIIETSGKKNPQILSTEEARQIVKALPDTLTSPVMTAQWEEALSGVVDGRVTPEQYMKSISDFVRYQISQVHSISGLVKPSSDGVSAGTEPCPVCGKNARRMESKKKKGSFFWVCENKEHGLMSDDNGKPGKLFESR
jgi:DNA topoisomerase-3